MQQVFDTLVEAIKRGEHPLPDALAMALPTEIDRLLEQGGPSADDWAHLATQGIETLEKGDVLLYGGKKGEAAKLFADFVRAVAVMAFVPGGVQLFGTRYLAKAKP